jgi:hypothetical protein
MTFLFMTNSPINVVFVSEKEIVSPRECFYPEDLMPFTRRPMFVIVDSDNAPAFLVVTSTP